MIKIIKKWRAILLILIALSPAAAMAILPLIYGVGLVLGGSPEIISALTIATVAVGAAIGWMTFGAQTSKPPSDAPLRIQLTPREKAPVPTGWSADPVAANVQPKPPGTAQSKVVWSDVTFPGRTSPDADALASDACKRSSPTSGAVFNSVNFNGDRIYECKVGTVTVTTVAINKTRICPAGYGPSFDANGVCYVSNATLVQKPEDGKCDVGRAAGGLFSTDPRDVDCKNSPGLYQGADGMEYREPSGEKRIRVYKDADGTTVVSSESITGGNLTHEYMILTPVTVTTQNGSYDEYRVSRTGSGAGASTLDSDLKANTGAPGAGAGVGTVAAPGTGSGSGGTAPGTPGTGSTCGGQGQPACGSGSAVCGAPPLPACKIDFGGTESGPGDPGAKTVGEIDGVLALPSLSPFKTFTMPGHASACPTTTINAFSRSFVMDAHCSLLDAHTATLRAAMVAVFGIAALFVLLKA